MSAHGERPYPGEPHPIAGAVVPAPGDAVRERVLRPADLERQRRGRVSSDGDLFTRR